MPFADIEDEEWDGEIRVRSPSVISDTQFLSPLANFGIGLSRHVAGDRHASVTKSVCAGRCAAP